MGQTNLAAILIPVAGMSCSGCTTNVERALTKLPGVSQASADLAKKQVLIQFDPDLVDLTDFRNAVQSAGYSVPSTEVLLKVDGMTCVSCAAHVGGALEDLSGTLTAEVNLSKGTARVNYIPTLTTIPEMEAAVSQAGYRVTGTGDLPSTTALPPESNPTPKEQGFSTARFSTFRKLFGRR